MILMKGDFIFMDALLAQATLLFTWVFDQLLVVISTVTAEPILLISLLVMLVGLVIGIFKRLVSAV